MAKARKSARRPASSHRSARTHGPVAVRSTAGDAIALLKADHRQVEEWFDRFESSGSSSRKKALAGQICQALEVHMRIE